MKIILKSCTIVSDKEEFDRPQDILIEDGIITDIAEKIDQEADHYIEKKGLHISEGWFDAKVNFCDPGNEVKEDLFTGLKSAEAGGMTGVAITPNTTPVVSNKSQIEYVKMKGAFSSVDVYPYASLTQNMEGSALSEMYDLKQAGAIGFTDCNRSVSSGIMYRALLYAKNFNGCIISFPWDDKTFGKGFVHEGKLSVNTGLKSIPSLAEYMIIERDLNLSDYTEGAIHFTGISTKESVSLIRAAKKKGIQVTADVYVHNLIYNQDNVMGFDAHYKVLPPLRAEEDRIALIKGLKDGTIDFVCSDHTPEDIENKEVEFDQAAFGMIGVQSLFPMLNSIETLTIQEKINLISKNPKKVFSIPKTVISIGETANLTLFSPTEKVNFSAKELYSKSKNTPIIGKEFLGKVYGTINNGILSLSE